MENVSQNASIRAHYSQTLDSQNMSLNSSAELDLDESNDELSSLISKAKALNPSTQPRRDERQKASAGAATRRLLERQRDALRIDNQQLLQEADEMRLQLSHAAAHECAQPSGRVAPLLFGMLLGLGLGFLAARFVPP
jgi:hypothetical protein